jgi:hypothetical protein
MTAPFVAGEEPTAARLNDILAALAPLPYTVTWASSGTQPSIGNGTLTGRYLKMGTFVWAFVAMTVGSSTTYGTGSYTWSLPFTSQSYPAHSPWPMFVGSGLVRDVSASQYHPPTTTPNFIITHGGSAFGTIPSFNSTTPMTWANGDTITMNCLYQSI